MDEKTTWLAYAESWKVSSAEEKRALYEQALMPDCVYRDPLMEARGWDALLAYMQDFHRQIPGGHFVTTEFRAHHGRCLAQWQMRDGAGEVHGVGTSYGEFDPSGRLRSMTGFFEVPAPSGDSP